MIFETVMNISRELERKTAIEVTVKLMEEVGEMSQALLSNKLRSFWLFKKLS